MTSLIQALIAISARDPQSDTCGPAAPEICENGCIGCIARAALLSVNRKYHNLPSTGNLLRLLVAYAPQHWPMVKNCLERAEIEASGFQLVLRCPSCRGTLIYKRLDNGEIEVYHDCKAPRVETAPNSHPEDGGPQQIAWRSADGDIVKADTA
jgi:hypothetical protein